MRICQCWDDGNVDDIRLCELLRRHGARASFNLNPGLHRPARHHGWDYRGTKPVIKLAQGELTDVYRGFTIANHTIDHPHLTKCDDAELARQIGDGRRMLADLFRQPVLGFAYPFGEHDARVMAAVRAAGHVYARTCGTSLKPWPAADPMAFGSTCHHQAGEFWARYDRARAEDAVFYFWGHSYEFITEEDWAAYEAKLARIAADPQAQWVELPDLFE